jgi:rhodanese-related sulfurtransferase
MAKRVSPREAHELMGQGYVYVDVRSTPEFTEGHPAGAVLVPFAEMGPTGMQPNPQFVAQLAARFPKDAKLVIGCQAGGRSARAVAALEQSGFTALVDQRAGFGGARGPTGQVVEKGWRDEGLPVETGAAK